jgi:hypothetical protein
MKKPRSPSTFGSSVGGASLLCPCSYRRRFDVVLLVVVLRPFAAGRRLRVFVRDRFLSADSDARHSNHENAAVSNIARDAMIVNPISKRISVQTVPALAVPTAVCRIRVRWTERAWPRTFVPSARV